MVTRTWWTLDRVRTPRIAVALAISTALTAGTMADATAAPAMQPLHATVAAQGATVAGMPTALAGLARLPRKGRAPKTGYSRARFGQAWTDNVAVNGGHNGCDTRNDVLRRDLTSLRLAAGGCKVSSGRLNDPYTAKRISFRRGPGTSSRVLKGCPGRVLPSSTSTGVPRVGGGRKATPTSTAPTPAPAPAPSVYYRNCAAARDAGATPLHRGQPGYRSALDADSDGIACEWTG